MHNIRRVRRQHTLFTAACLAGRGGKAKDGGTRNHNEDHHGHPERRNRLEGRYHTVVEGHEAEITYSRTSPKLVIIDHTGVPDALRGKGVGQALAAFAVEAARTGGWKIMPLCPFFRAQATRHKDWQDVVNL